MHLHKHTFPPQWFLIPLNYLSTSLFSPFDSSDQELINHSGVTRKLDVAILLLKNPPPPPHPPKKVTPEPLHAGLEVLAFSLLILTETAEKHAEKFITEILRLWMNFKEQINSACLIARGAI